MATATIFPDSDISVQMNVNPAGTHFSAIDDANDTTDYIYGSAIAIKRDVFSVEDIPDDFATGTQISVVLYRATYQSGSIQVDWSKDGGANWSTALSAGGLVGEQTLTWIKQTITKAQMNNFQLRISGAVASSGTYTIYSAKVVVTYIPIVRRRAVMIMGPV